MERGYDWSNGLPIHTNGSRTHQRAKMQNWSSFFWWLMKLVTKSSTNLLPHCPNNFESPGAEGWKTTSLPKIGGQTCALTFQSDSSLVPIHHGTEQASETCTWTENLKFSTSLFDCRKKGVSSGILRSYRNHRRQYLHDRFSWQQQWPNTSMYFWQF